MFVTNQKYIRFQPSTIQNLDDWKSWLAAQYAAGTPVTIVYELETPETETLPAVSPIVPDSTSITILTDASAITATVHGSGWETINDVTDVRNNLYEIDNSMDTINGMLENLGDQISAVAEQIITPEEIKATVFESEEYAATQTEISQTARDVQITRTQLDVVDGRLNVIEEGVHIQGDTISLYTSDSPFRSSIDSSGFTVTEDGQETITARESMMIAPRARITDALILGSLAVKVGSDGHVRGLRYR